MVEWLHSLKGDATMRAYEGHEVTWSTHDNYDTLLEIVDTYDLSAEFILRVFVGWHGTQVCTPEFMDHLLGTELELESEEL